MSGVVIVGAGHAGFQCADSLRKGGFSGPITLIDADRHPPYHKPPLSKEYLQQDSNRDKLLFRTPEFYQQQAITLLTGSRVTDINRQTHTVTLESGDTVAYDKLILAPGSRIRRLNVPPDIAESICYIKTLDDIDTIRTRLTSSQQVVVIGGGFIGLEFASTAAKLGKQVQVLVRGQRVLEHSLTPELSEYLMDQHHQNGVTIQLRSAFERIERLADGKLAVIDQTGNSYPADLIVAGIGATSETGLAQAAGLECDDGILVDACCQTSDPDIYAAGDAVRCFHPLLGMKVRLESVQNAVDQAKVIAANILGNVTEYSSVPWFWSDQFDIKLQMVGLHHGYDETVWRGSPEDGRFSLFYYRSGKLIAVHSVNKPADHMSARKLIAAQKSPAPALVADHAIRLNDLLKQA